MEDKILKEIVTDKTSMLKKYQKLFVGDQSLFFLIKFEIITLFLKNLPGALGLILRKIFFKKLFKKVGSGVIFGTNMTIRNPKNIEIGDDVVIDDNCVLDAKGEQCKGIRIGNSVFISRNVIMGCKNGGITIESNVTIGPFSIIHSIGQSAVTIGDYSVIAAYCYFIGAANYKFERTDIPMAEQGLETGKGIELEKDVWIGASSQILDGTKIGQGSIIGVNSMVKDNIPPYSIAFGSPARVRKNRKEKGDTNEQK